MKTKLCKGCNQDKLTTDFPFSGMHRYRRSLCSTCYAIYEHKRILYGGNAATITEKDIRNISIEQVEDLIRHLQSVIQRIESGKWWKISKHPLTGDITSSLDILSDYYNRLHIATAEYQRLVETPVNT